ncbi:MAG: energy transducer TonB [Saprospiraceae bacterium]
MVNRGWLYGLIVFLAQTCNPYYSANDSRNQDRDEVVTEEGIYIPDEAFEIDEAIEVEPPRNRNRVMEEPPPPPPAPQEEIFKVVEEMPRFPGCEQKGIGRTELKKCSQDEMLKFVGENVKYPEIAKENGLEGRVIVQFVVGRSGKIKNAQVLRDIGGGCGKEAIRVVNSMPKWIPGKQRGRPVNVQYTLPVSFKLSKGEETTLDEEPMFMPMPVEPEQEAIFKVVEDMPRYPGCEDKGLNRKELRKCSEEELLKFVYGNLEYPKVARENGIEGRAILQWVVNPNGSISDIKVLRDPGGGCGQAAVNVIQKMPKWIPGKQRGKAVPVQYTFPVQFKLEKKGK